MELLLRAVTQLFGFCSNTGTDLKDLMQRGHLEILGPIARRAHCDSYPTTHCRGTQHHNSLQCSQGSYPEGKSRLHAVGGSVFPAYSHTVCHTQHLMGLMAKGCPGKRGFFGLFVPRVARLYFHMLMAPSRCQPQLPTQARDGGWCPGYHEQPRLHFFHLPPGCSVWEFLAVQDKMLYLYSCKALTDSHSRVSIFFFPA